MSLKKSTKTNTDTVMSSEHAKNEMLARWEESLLLTNVPPMDIEDQKNITSKRKRKRNKQFWPEYTQKAYEEAFSKQVLVGDYTSSKVPNAIKITGKQREGLIALIAELHKKKQYRKDTLFIAFDMLDRFLSRGKLD